VLKGSEKVTSSFHEVVPYLSGRNASYNQTFNHISFASIYNDGVQSVKSNKWILHNIYESGVLKSSGHGSKKLPRHFMKCYHTWVVEMPPATKPSITYHSHLYIMIVCKVQSQTIKYYTIYMRVVCWRVVDTYAKRYLVITWSGTILEWSKYLQQPNLQSHIIRIYIWWLCAKCKVKQVSTTQHIWEWCVEG
jgi:hypothetical protein